MKYYITAPNNPFVYTLYNVEQAIEKANTIEGQVWVFIERELVLVHCYKTQTLAFKQL